MKKEKETEVIENNGNGHKNALEIFEQKAISDAASTMRELTESGPDALSFEQKLGVLQRVVTAVGKDEDYRQVLLLAAFDNKQEALLASDAITERQRYGVSIHPILTRIIAQCAVKSGRVDKVLGAMTTYSLNTNSHGGMPNWKKKQDDRGIG